MAREPTKTQRAQARLVADYLQESNRGGSFPYYQKVLQALQHFDGLTDREKEELFGRT